MRATAMVALLAAGALGCPGSRAPATGHNFGDPVAVEPDIEDEEGDTPRRPPFPEEPFRKAQPPAGEPRDFQLPAVHTFRLGDQIDVYLVERHELPTVSIDLNFDGGSVHDARGKEGVASVCMNLLSEGTRKLDKLAFREALGDVASSVNSYAGDETQGVGMSTLSRHFDRTFELFVDTLLEPGLRADELERMIARRLESLKQAKGTPASVAARLRPGIAFGPDHPFGRIVTEASLRAIRIADCRAYHRAWVKPRGARLFVVGAMTEAEVREKFAPLLKQWRGAQPRAKKLPAARPRAGRVFFAHVPGAEQSSIFVVHGGPERKAPDYYATMMMSRILAGGFTSRLNMNLREDKGYSYGAGGGFRYYRELGSFLASTSVEVKATYDSVLEVMKEIRGIQSEDGAASADELEREKLGAIEALPAGFATAGQALGQFRNLIYYGLPLDYYNGYVESVSGVTLEEVRTAASARLLPAEARVLVVGDADALQIRRVGKEDTALEDSDGNPLTLRTALNELAQSPELGAGKLIMLDADGKVVD